MPGVKPLQPFGQEAQLPATDEYLAANQPPADLTPAHGRRQEQDEPCSLHVCGGQAARPGARFEFGPFGLGQNDWKV
ncbi:MAG TPA: hypothetical protein VIO80_14425 [Candidatus Dormibacteraeota bacterium]